MPLFGPPNVDKLKRKRDVKGLVKALGHRDAYVAAMAERALRELGDARALEPLAGALHHTSPTVRRKAATLMGELRDSRAVQLLKAAIVEERVGWAARQALAEALRHTWTFEQLVAALTAECQPLRQAAAQALGEFKDSRALRPLAGLLHDKDKWVAKAAREATTSVASESLILAAQERDGDTFDDCVRALQAAGSSALVPLRDGISAKRVRIRRAAIWGLRRIGHEDAVPWLRQALDDASRQVRVAAATSLIVLGHRNAESVRALSSVARGRGHAQDVWAIEDPLMDLEPLMRHRAARALRGIEEPRAVPPLGGARRFLAPGETVVEERAWLGVSSQRGTAKLRLVRALRLRRPEDARIRWITVKYEAPLTPDTTRLVSELKHPDEGNRWLAATALALLEDRSAVRALTEALSDRNIRVRQVAKAAISELGSQVVGGTPCEHP